MVIANSIGAVVTAAWVHDYAPRIRAMVLATPAFSIKLYVPFALPLLRLQMKLQKNPFVKSYVRPGMLTSDPVEVDAYAQDGMIARSVSVRILSQMDYASQRILEDAAAITTPTLVLSAGSDWVVRTEPQKKFFDRLSSEQKAYEHYPGMKHAIFHEAERSRPIQRTREFVRHAFESPFDRTPLQDPARYSLQELERLSRPAPPLKRAGYALTRGAIAPPGKIRGLGRHILPCPCRFPRATTLSRRNVANSSPRRRLEARVGFLACCSHMFRARSGCNRHRGPRADRRTGRLYPHCVPSRTRGHLGYSVAKALLPG